MSTPRNPVPADLPGLVQIWHDGWHEAHGGLVPPDLVAARDMTDFDRRLRSLLDQTRVLGPSGAPIGFCSLRGEELMQLFVSPEVRGTGAALTLMKDGERRLRTSGVAVAWLACVIGNDRAARFYSRHGWQRMGSVQYRAETASGVISVTEWKYEKAL